MTTKLEHSDHILASEPGVWLLACDLVFAVNMRAGGRIHYPVGARFRVKFSTGDLIWCLDEEARSVAFDRENMWSMECAS